MKRKKLSTLPTTAMSHLAQYARSEWYIKVPMGTTLEMLLTPSFWAHHQVKLRIGDKIEAIAEDGTFDVDLRVIDKDVGYAKMRVLRKWEASANPEVVVEGQNQKDYTGKPQEFPCINFLTSTGWRLLGFDGNTVKQHMATKDEAQHELDEYLRRAQAAA